MQYSINHQPQSIQEDLNQQRMNDVLKAVQSLVEKLCQQEQATNLSTHTPEPSRHFNSICYDDDDDEESTIPLNEIISQILLSNVITPVLPTMEPKDSLSMGDEHLSTIPKKESDEFINSSVEDLVPIPRKSVTFSNPLFDLNDDFTSSIDESLSDEDVPEDNGDILLLEKLLNDDPSSPLPPKEHNFEELKVIKSDVSTDFEDDYYDSEGDIIYLESLLIKNTIPNLPPEEFLDHDPRSLKDEHDNDNLKSMVKVFDPGFHIALRQK
ncbi:hypothetical protein Tco_1238780 [Tanacetum coccineum]